MKPKESRCENCITMQLNALKTLSKHELKKISNSKVTQYIKKGETLFEEGDRLEGVFCVRKGATKLSKVSENGKEQIVKLATKGELLGQRSVISGQQSNLSAVALNDMEVCYIPKNHLTENVNVNIAFTKAMLIKLAEDLKFSDTIIVNLAQKNVNQRIAETLFYLYNNFGVDHEEFISLIISRNDIANIVGTTKEGCIRTISEFRKNGVIQTKGKRIKLSNKEELRRIAKGF